MRILLVSNTGFQYLDAVIPALESRGVQFRRLATDDLRKHQKRFAQSDVRVIREYYFDRSSLAAFRAILEEFSPDIVHVTGLRSTLIKTLIAVRSYPTMRVVHERISAGGIDILSPLDWTLFRNKRISRIIMPSHAMLNNWMGSPFYRHMVDARRCEVLHYAINLPPAVDRAARMSLRRSLGLDENAFIVGTACIIRPWKNVEFVAEVVASIESKTPLQFGVIGPDTRKPGYLDRIRAVGGSRLKLLGYIPNAVAVMPAFDVYVTPTALPGESFGVAFAEAMSHGVPSLTMNFGASAELCEPGISGYALPANKHVWRSVIEDLMNDPNKRESMGRAARRRIETHFSPDVTAERYLSTYSRAMSE